MKIPTIKQAMAIAASVAAIAGTIASGVWAMESRYANSSDIVHVVKTVKDLRCDVIESKLDELLLKREHGELREYEKIRLEQLRREWERVCNTSSGDG